MVAQDFRDLLAQRPFEPFRVVMSSGDRYELRHPEMAFLSRSTLYIGMEVEDGIPSRYQMCSLLHVATIEPLENQSTT